MTAVRIPVEQGSSDWLEARRTRITASDIPVLLGLSPYRSEAQLAAEKLEGTGQESSIHMRVGLAMEPLIAAEYTTITGRSLRRFHGLIQHPGIEWAAASPDWSVVGEKRLVEGKWSASRSRFAELPQDVEAQVVWQLGCMGYPVADVAALVAGEELRLFEVEAQPAVFADLVAVAVDFRRRLEAGGPFAHNESSVKAAYPTDDGSTLEADAELIDAVHRLQMVRLNRSQLEEAEEALKVAIQSRMGPASKLVGPDFTVTWKRTRDITKVDWKSVADGLLRQLPEPERTALVGIASTVSPGFRPLRVVMKGEPE